ncbi:MAG: tRNA(His) guanylyltransferase Thg1 family protein [Nannocystaceae bacterium]|nr:tRNA(His) guanylyltransferase Thg1 family protein [Myxococcales bacterium]
MSERTALGERMKSYERAEAGRRFLPTLPICARLDGKRFSRWTDGLARPYDPRLSALMIAVTKHMVEETHAKIGYTQSDEITLVFHSDDPKRQVFVDGRIQKLVSLLASMTTARFNAALAAAIPERADAPALFDCRAWVLPSREEAVNVLLWRERDASKNSLSMAARAHYPHAQLEARRGPALHELLHAVGINWNDYPAFFKRGTYVRRETVARAFTADERAALPPMHAARENPDLLVERSEVRALELPPLDKVVNRVAVVFEGAAPEVEGDEASA